MPTESPLTPLVEPLLEVLRGRRIPPDAHALSAMLWAYLRERDWSPEEIESTFRFPQGALALRLRDVHRFSTRARLSLARGHRGAVTGVGWLPAGGIAHGLVRGAALLSWGEDGAVKLWSLEGGGPVRTLHRHEGAVTGCSPARRGSDTPLLVSSSRDHTLALIPLAEDAVPRGLHGHRDEVLGVGWMHQETLVSWSADGTLRCWSHEGEPLQVLRGHRGAVTAALPWQMAMRENRVVSGGEDGTVRLWDADTGKVLSTRESHTAPVTVLAAEGDRIASGGEDARVVLGRYGSTSEEPRTLGGHALAVTALAFQPDGDLFSASLDRTVRVWDLESGECRKVLEGHEAAVLDLAVAKEGVVSASADGTVRLWRQAEGWRSEVVHRHDLPVRAVSPDRDQGRIASASEDRTLRLSSAGGSDARILDGRPERRGPPLVARGRILSVAAGGELRALDLTSGEVVEATDMDPEDSSFSRSPVKLAGPVEGRVVAWADRRFAAFELGEVSLVFMGAVDLEDGDPVRALSVISPRVLALVRGSALELWETGAGEPLHRAEPPEGVRGCLALPSENRILTWNRVGELRLWDSSLSEHQVAGHHEAPVLHVAVSPAGVAASSAADGTLTVWDLVSGGTRRPPQNPSRVRRTFRDLPRLATAVALSADGEWVARGDADGGVLLAPSRGSEPPRRLATAGGPATAVHFAGEGPEPLLVVASEDGALEAWEPQSGRRIGAAWADAALVSLASHEELVVANDEWGNLRVFELDLTGDREETTAQVPPGPPPA